MGERCIGVAIACALALGGVARADALQPEELAKKNEGGYVTGLPLFAYSTDLGFGGGARAYYFWNGKRDDPRFAETSYLYRVFLQAFVSTRGTQFHWLDFDAPKVFSTPYRLRSQLILQRDTSSNYFGLGDRALGKLHFPGSAQSYGKFSDYAAAEAQVSDGTTYEKYDQYDLLRPLFIASVERLVLGDRVRLLAGLGFSYARVHDYTGKAVEGATEAETRLHADCDAGLVVGCHGGRDDYVRLGISYDTRDYEPDPNKGVFLDAGLDLGTVALGSQYDYARFLVTARGYWSPFPAHADLVLAGRALVQMQTSDTPFFSMNTLPFTDDPRAGLGGHRTLRGYRQDRFVGPVMTLVNGEIRWTFAHATLWKQKFGFIAVPFVDDGRPYDSLSDLSVHDWQLSYGGALRISWNLATIVTIDYGRSHEDTGFYVNFNHIF